MATCYKLISCHPNYYSNIELVSHPDLDLIHATDPASIVAVNANLSRGYTIEKYVRAFWQNIGFDAEYISGVDFNSYTLTSFVYNGTEYVTGLYEAGTAAFPSQTTAIDFLNAFTQSVGLLDINFIEDLSGNISVLIQDTDTLDIDLVTAGTNGAATYGTHEYFYNGDETSTYIFDSVTYNSPSAETDIVDSGCDTCDDITSVQPLTECPNVNPFCANLIDGDDYVSVTEIPGCLGLNIVDETIYSNNTEGHGLANFSDYIRIELTRGDNSIYVMSSVAGVDVDQAVAAPANNPTNYYPYYFEDSDVDGIYNILLEVYPTWDPAVAYTTTELTVVYRDGVLYKLLSNDTGSAPELNPTIWELYEATTEEALLTRYVTQQKIVVLCITINNCEEKLIHQAFCLIDSDFCNDNVLCSNPAFLKANKYILIKKALEISVAKSAWNEVEKQLNALKSICH